MKIDIQDQRLHEFGLVCFCVLIGLVTLFPSGCQLTQYGPKIIATLTPPIKTLVPPIATAIAPPSTPTPKAEDPYSSVDFKLPDGPPRKMPPNDVKYDSFNIPLSFYKAHFDNWMQTGDQNCTAVYYDDYVDVDVTDTHWNGGGVDHILIELYYWNSDKTYNYTCIDFTNEQGRRIFRMFWDYAKRIDGLQPPIATPEATPTQEHASGCGNVPDIPCNLSEIDESGWSKESKRNYSAPRSKVGEFHGEVFCGNHEASTNFRYRFRSHIEWDINRFCGFKAGEINIYFTGQNDEMVRWQVTP